MSAIVKYGKVLRRGIYGLIALVCVMLVMLYVARFQYQQRVLLETEESLLRQHGLELFEKVRTAIELHRLQPGLVARLGRQGDGSCVDEDEGHSLQAWARSDSDTMQNLTQRVVPRMQLDGATAQAPLLVVADNALRMTSRIALGKACDRPWWRVLQTQVLVLPQMLKRPPLPFSSDPQLHVLIDIGTGSSLALDLLIHADHVAYFPAAVAASLPRSLEPGQSQVKDGRFQMRLRDERTGLSMVFSSSLLGRGDLWGAMRANALTLLLWLGFALALFGALWLLWHFIAVSERLHHLSTRDPLTGLYNRRAAMERANTECSRALRTGWGFCVVQVDIDHFKRINDSFGHDAGDSVLQFFAARLQEAVRQEDLVARMGGEEFLLLLPNTDLCGAREVAERLRGLLHAAPVSYGEERISVTCSLGLSAWRGAGDSLQELLIRADYLLYQAKQQGRDRCVDDSSALDHCAQPA
ncbi:GGDEF domain-containing protein [Aquipseudomonas alcaligenes]|uniref:GGDEF domain-containing protein n=1 Tax=Aquipseudomonas alcaligenes TaxID=43263 RepID=UPI0037479C7A